MTESLAEFKTLFNEWELGVRSLVYRHAKAAGTPAFASEVKRFEDGLTAKMDAAWRRLSPFQQAEFIEEREVERKRRAKRAA